MADTQEIQLWQTVIIQAVLDLAAISNKHVSIDDKIKTSKWFSLDNRDFLDVCSMAGWSPNWVIKNIKRGRFMGHKMAGFKTLRRGAKNVARQTFGRY